MKSFFKYLGVISFLLFGFYYTEKMSLIVNNNSKLMIDINNKKDDYEIKAVNAEINGNYITPGLNGYRVNVLKSYDKMKEINMFNQLYLVYDRVIPNISLDNNKDKIINKGNKKKREVSILIDNNNEILEFSKKNNINITLINTLLLNNICFIKDNNINECQNKYLVTFNKYLDNYNIAGIKTNIESGDIIYIKDSAKLVDFKIMLRQIYYQELKIVYLSKLINEERD